MAVKKDGGLAGSFERFRVDKGMQVGANDFDRGEAGGAEMIGDPTGCAFDVRLMLAFCADARDAKKFAELGEVLVVARVDMLGKIHKGTYESFRNSRLKYAKW